MLLGPLLERFMIISIHHKAYHSQEQKAMLHSFCMINDSHVMREKTLRMKLQLQMEMNFIKRCFLLMSTKERYPVYVLYLQVFTSANNKHYIK